MADTPPELTALAGMPEQELDAALAALAAADPMAARQVDLMLQQAREDAQREAEARRERLRAIGLRITGLYRERVSLRREIEERWLRDIRRYNGQYEPDVERRMKSREYGSRAFVPLTRRICGIVEGRVFDLLFPAEDRNFAVTASPEPGMSQAQSLARRLDPQAMVNAGNGPPVQAGAMALAISDLREEAALRAEAMQRTVDDQLRESNYAAHARRAIHDAIVLGTGILKGPYVKVASKRVWTEAGAQTMERIVPAVTHVPIWNFYPDPAAATLADSESEIEVHRMTKAQLAQLARQPGFEQAQEVIARLMRAEPGRSTADDQRQGELRAHNGLQSVADPRHCILEYRGPVTLDELRDLGVQVPDDALQCYEGILWVSEADGEVLKAAIEPMHSQQRPYSAYCWERDPASIFGYGLSYELADSQEAANSAFRGAMDNMGLSVGAQTVVNDRLVEPDNGKWVLEPNKVWRAKKTDADVRAAFGFFQIDSRLSELLALFDRSKQIMEDVGGPAMAMQGQEAPSYLETARGAGIAWNSANIWMRRAARHWDDDVTASLVQRFVDWNMQFNPDPNIKGDLAVMARGSGALLEAEGMVSKLAMFMQQASSVPMPFKRRVAQLRAMARGLRIDPADVLPDDEEVRRIAEQADNQPPPTDPAVERIRIRELEIQDKERDREFQWQLAQANTQLRMAEIASREGLTREQAQAKYGIDLERIRAEVVNKREQRAHEAQMMNAELAAKAQMGSGI